MKKTLILLVFFLTAAIFAGAGCINTSGSGNNAMGMYRSDDRGDSWKQIAALPTPKGVQSIAGVRVYRIFTDPSDPDALYLGTRGQGMYYTYNKGDSWQTADALNGRFIYSVAVDPKDKCTLYVTDGANIYKSTDCSRTWKSVLVS